jgi:hypothetical protein
MDIRQFRSELAEAFEAAGFERRRAKPPWKATIWVLPGREVERAFWEQAIRRSWGFLLSGSLTIDVPAFRAWLTEKFPRKQHGILSGSLLNLYIANERDMFFAVEQEAPPYFEWIKTIRSRLVVLPDTIDGLLKAEREHAQGLMRLWDEHDSPKAWAYFKAWADGAEPKSPLPHRLPNWQVVDTARNDLT